VIDRLDPVSSRFAQDSCLELACGSANLGLLLAPRVARYAGMDQSEAMLDRARARWAAELDPQTRGRYPAPPFSRGNLLELSAGELGKPDWIAISFALHLFPPAEENALLRTMFQAARKGVIVIDHEQRWTPGAAFVEWIEGSWYGQFVKLDFGAAARELGAEFHNRVTEGCQVMEFLKPATHPSTVRQ
jgi:ubiquinone/menaquinone biosynthesis C-methylase UbiE